MARYIREYSQSVRFFGAIYMLLGLTQISICIARIYQDVNYVAERTIATMSIFAA